MSGVAATLAPNASQYSFFQLVRLLEQYRRKDAGAKLEVRYRATPSLAFQASEVTAVKDTNDSSGTLTVETALIGLYGPSSPLPLYYTEDVLDDTPESQVLRDLLDIFNHRAHQLLQAVWEKYRLPLRMRPDATDSATAQLAALARLSRSNGYPFRYLDARRLLPFTGMLAFNSGSARVIEQVLRYYFEVPQLRVIPNRLRYVSIPEDQTCSLGGRGRLGVDLVLGGEILDCSSGFHISFDKVPHEVAKRFYPETADCYALRELVDFLSPLPLEFSLSFEIQADSIPQACLGDEQAQLGLGLRLGEGGDECVRVEFA